MTTTISTVRLGDVCTIDKSQGIHRDMPYVGLEDIESQTGHFIGSGEPRSVKSSTFRFSAQHVLYGRLRPYLSKAMAPDFEGHCSTEIFPLRPTAGLSRKYLLYWLLSGETVDRINATSTGARMPRADMNEVLDFEFPLVPLADQRRIVDILDKASEGIAAVAANAERNVREAQALFDSHLQSVLTRGGSDWTTRKLGDVCTIARGGSPRPIQKFLTSDADGINWIKISDATASGKYIYETEEKIIPEGAKRSRVVSDGDFLLSNSMSFGRPYIMRTTGCIHDGWLVLSDYATTLDQDFLYDVLGSPVVFQQFDRLAAGSTVRNLNIDLASRTEIPIPPLRQQRDIAAQAGELSGQIQELVATYQRKLTELDALKTSLLFHAFSGQLL